MTYNIIHHRGTVKQAVLENGEIVKRYDELFIPEWGAFVKCASYEEHFIFENPDKKEGSPAYVCTCGGVAMVRGGGSDGLFVCMIHENLGDHSTSFYNVKDIDKIAGKTIEVSGKRGRVRDK